MIGRCFTLAARARVYQLVAVVLCCCNVGRGDVSVPASFCLPLLPVSEAAESEQAPSESAPEEGEASWAIPRGRDVRQLGASCGRACEALQERAAQVRPALRRTIAAPATFEHSFRSGLGAPLRL